MKEVSDLWEFLLSQEFALSGVFVGSVLILIIMFAIIVTNELDLRKFNLEWDRMEKELKNRALRYEVTFVAFSPNWLHSSDHVDSSGQGEVKTAEFRLTRIEADQLQSVFNRPHLNGFYLSVNDRVLLWDLKEKMSKAEIRKINPAGDFIMGRILEVKISIRKDSR